MKIAGMIRDEGKAAIIAVNKWDALDKETGTLEKYRLDVLDKLKFLSYAPVLFISALTGQRVIQVWDTVSLVNAHAGIRIPTGHLNELLGEAQLSLQPPMEGGRRLKIFYATQQGVYPPSFILFVNDVDLMHFSYERYLENQFRKSIDFTGTPIRFILREREKEGGQ